VSDELHEVWDAIDHDLRWSTGFFVDYVFVAQPRQARALATRLRRQVDPASLFVLDAERAADLHEFAANLPLRLEAWSRPRELHQRPLLWLAGTLEFEANANQPWRRAWADLLGRLNERRELLRAYLRALVVVAPMQSKPALRSIAPDLWSIRSHAVEFPPLPARLADPPSPARQPTTSPDIHSEREFDPRQDPRVWVRDLIEAVRRARATERIEDLVACEPLRVALLAWAKAAAREQGDERPSDELLDVWLEQVELAITLAQPELARRWLAAAPMPAKSPRGRTLALHALVLSGELALRDDSDEAAARLDEAARLEHSLFSAAPSPYGDRIELGLARVARARGDALAAAAHCERSLALRRSSAAMRERAELHVEAGELEPAIALLDELVVAARDASSRVATLRELASALMLAGHHPLARARLDAALALAAEDARLQADVRVELGRLFVALGDEPQARRELLCAVELRTRELGQDHEATRRARARLDTIMPTTLALLHVSDLHFGPKHRFKAMPPEKLASRLAKAITGLMQQQGLARVDLVIASGDLTARAEREEFTQARAFFEGLSHALRLAHERFAFVPGNHDFSWAHIKLCRAQQAVEKFDDAELERRIHAEKFANYREFITGFLGEIPPHRDLQPTGWVQDIPELRVSLGLLNSSERETEQAPGGAISSHQADALLSHWLVDAGDPALRIVVIHHNPKSTTPENLAYKRDTELKGKIKKRLEQSLGGTTPHLDDLVDHFTSDIYGFQGTRAFHDLVKQAEVSLVLHGHIHAVTSEVFGWQRGGDTRVLGAGSMGDDPDHMPEIERNMVQLLVLHLDRRAPEVELFRLEYDARATVPGEVERGNFVPAAASVGGHEHFALSLPRGFIRDAPVVPTSSQPPRDFMSAYRAAFAHEFETWRFPLPGRVQPVALDRMFVAPRFQPRDSSRQPHPLPPEQLIADGPHVIVRGGVGSGKSTWLRWTFRRLLERDDVLPILIELRNLTRDGGPPLTLDEALSAWAARVGEGSRDALDRASPRPILLLDGWDELGERGDEFGAQLARFADAHPHVRIVATMRPHGEGLRRNELDDRYESLDLEPMSDREIEEFVAKFLTHARSAPEGIEPFLARLRANSRAHELARTPLLATMLLHVARDQPLPERRHELYGVALEQLLQRQPRERQKYGVLAGRHEWAPASYADKRRALAMLAHAMQIGSRSHDRHVIARRHELTRVLGNWDFEDPEGFVTWLAQSAGVLVEYDDGSLQFVHLGFQEYLTALHLDATLRLPQEHLDGFLRHAAELGWWETLRLWAAIIDDRPQSSLDDLLTNLLETSFWLVGAILADGVGDAVFSLWLSRLTLRPLAQPPERACMQAWSRCAQGERRNAIARRLIEQAPDPDFLTATLLDDVIPRFGEEWHTSTFKESAHLRRSTVYLSLTKNLGGAGIYQDRDVAFHRVLMSTSPFWGIDIPTIYPLRLVLGPRPWLGWLLQSAIVMGAKREDLCGLATWMRPGLTSPRADLSVAVEQLFARRSGLDAENAELTTQWVKEVGQYLGTLAGHAVTREPLAIKRLWSESTAALDKAIHYSTHSIDLFEARQLSTNFAHVRTYQCATTDSELAAALLESSPIDLQPAPWMRKLCNWLAGSVGYAGVRTLFASIPADGHDILRTACRCSFDPTLDPSPLHQPSEGHPLWPALARHIARIATPADRALLKDLLRHPEHAEDYLLTKGLKYWVRGDLVFEDGSEMTLDDLWQELRHHYPDDDIPDLPLLEDMPP
jgi:tetratricopeptide (TPR) repeat protein